ncbi:MAG: ABC transporter permease subunit [Hyphomicrobiales bacterium]|nr:ABC transporter permease subunit [Hyphomicrobiales bacterium]
MTAASPGLAPVRGARRARPARDLAIQAALILAIGAALAFLSLTAYRHMVARGIPLGFSFWNQPAGFAIDQSLISYGPSSTVGRAFLVGLINTLIVSALAIAISVPLGFVVGAARLSPNWIVARVAAVWVEGLRNTPLLLQLLFWYNAVLRQLPSARDSIALWPGALLNQRGLYLPRPVPAGGFIFVAAAAIAGLFAALAIVARARRVDRDGRLATGAITYALAALVAPPIVASALSGAPLTFDWPAPGGFNVSGGLHLFPEFVALLFGLSLYSSSYMAEVVRGGLQAVPKGQREAASALGLARRQTLLLVTGPQAMRAILPPLTSQCVNVVKNSSLAVFIGYPDLVAVFPGSTIERTQAAVQVMAITLGVYLVLSVSVSALIGLYDRRQMKRGG